MKRLTTVVLIAVLVTAGLVVGGLFLKQKLYERQFTITTNRLYGKVSCAVGGCEIRQPCVANVPPASHVICTKYISAADYNKYVQPQLDKIANENMKDAIEHWKAENGGPLDYARAEELCSAAFDSDNSNGQITDCIIQATKR